MADRTGADSEVRSYRWVILPFGLFSLVSGFAFVIGGILTDERFIFMPPLRAEFAKRLSVMLVGVYVGLMGAGLIAKVRAAWYGMFLYLGIGSLWHVSTALTGWIPPEMAIVSPVFMLVFGAGFYHFGKPVFEKRSS